MGQDSSTYIYEVEEHKLYSNLIMFLKRYAHALTPMKWLNYLPMVIPSGDPTHEHSDCSSLSIAVEVVDFAWVTVNVVHGHLFFVQDQVIH